MRRRSIAVLAVLATVTGLAAVPAHADAGIDACTGTAPVVCHTDLAPGRIWPWWGTRMP
ncbi:hypothetical protein ABCR94_15340 [Streptomyces sp. 21So2-11]|uniref:hypothetical protein n=1 Tax=Streptomyces sp. 21So2-11 TaxID=3144408 RepID=UPI00321B65A2